MKLRRPGCQAFRDILDTLVGPRRAVTAIGFVIENVPIDPRKFRGQILLGEVQFLGGGKPQIDLKMDFKMGFSAHNHLLRQRVGVLVGFVRNLGRFALRFLVKDTQKGTVSAFFH